MNGLFAGVEAGGTKFVCGLGRGPRDILARCVTPTRSPQETMARVVEFFTRTQAAHGAVDALGIASFGPLDLDLGSSSYGSIIRTTKPGWSGFDLRSELAQALACPVSIDTDVSGAGMAETVFGSGRNLRSIAYVTVGTGIGGALIVDGAPVHRNRHPEMGHLIVRRHPLDGDFAGVCPYHHDCLEGLACGPSVLARYGAPLSELPKDAAIWTILADYLAQLCFTITLVAAPDRIVMGGGVLTDHAIFPLIHAALLRLNQGYFTGITGLGELQRYIVPPALGNDAGLAGAMMLARSLCDAPPPRAGK